MKIPYRVIINGRRALNGQSFGVVINGTATPENEKETTFATPGPAKQEPDLDIYDFAHELIEHLRDQAAEEKMILPHSLQLTLGPDAPG